MSRQKNNLNPSRAPLNGQVQNRIAAPPIAQHQRVPIQFYFLTKQLTITTLCDTSGYLKKPAENSECGDFSKGPTRGGVYGGNRKWTQVRHTADSWWDHPRAV